MTARRYEPSARQKILVIVLWPFLAVGVALAVLVMFVFELGRYAWRSFMDEGEPWDDGVGGYAADEEIPRGRIQRPR